MKNELLEALFAEHYHGALLYALSLTKDKATAEDLVSNAFFKALRRPDGEIASFKSWLLTVVRREYLSSLRRRKFEGEMPEQAEDSEALLETIIKDEEYRALYHAISLLPESYRELITLFYFENLSVKDMARVTKKSESHVKTALCRARMKLKELLEQP
ncbi:MAG: sigma-70 family RNA polymerase sigma factor [Clostridia bacterium]|nr:sigma-70 family RNA polymerase sigma factor [Clostridia bacterium]